MCAAILPPPQRREPHSSGNPQVHAEDYMGLSWGYMGVIWVYIGVLWLLYP